MEIPHLEQFQHTRGAEGLRVISLGNDFNYYTCQGWADLGANYLIADDRASAIWSDFGFGGVPYNVIIDGDGVVRFTGITFSDSEISTLLDELLGATSVDNEVHQPESIRLISTYPNPFNAGTQIQFQLEEAGNIALVVYDTQGRKVRTLVNGPVEAGDHALKWFGWDDRGNDLSSGVYIVQLQSGLIRDSKKVILLK